ncbi:MAG: hypothetical protein V4631_01175 [Pseudomonadota bacterium]
MIGTPFLRRCLGILLVCCAGACAAQTTKADKAKAIELSKLAAEITALDIVRSAAPFDRFPARMVSPEIEAVWIIITDFSFTREEAPDAEAGEVR